jgi:hypothetical protein
VSLQGVSRRGYAVVVASLLVGALVGTALVSLSLRTSAVSSTEGGLTLDQALRQVNTTVQNANGGPWELFSYIGFAAEGAFNPAAFSLGTSTNLSLRYCGAQLPGITLWNGSSIPVFDGSVAAGTAPFWQFEFFSNTTKDVVVATDVSGVVRAYPPILPTDSCWLYAGGGAASSYLSWVNPLPEDSNVQAQLAYDRVARTFESSNRPVVEIFADGFTPLGAIGHGPNGGVEFFRCGLEGVAGVQPFLIVGFSPSGQIFDTINGTVSCTATYSIGPPPVYTPYTIIPSAPRSPSVFGSGFESVSFSFQTEFSTGVNNSTRYYDAWGLLSWMVSLSLRNSSGQSLPTTPLSCQAWVSTVASCTPMGLGWSVILTSADGAWLDAFPSASSALLWSLPVGAIASYEQLILTYPNSWNITGDSLVFSNSAPVPTIAGLETF